MPNGLTSIIHNGTPPNLQGSPSGHSFSHRLTAYKFVGISLDCNIWICLGIIRSKIAFFRISNISVPYLYAQLRGRTVIKKLWSFFLQRSRSLLVTAMLNFSVKATLFNFFVLDQKKYKI